MISKNHKKVCTALNYIKHLPVLASAVTGCISACVVASLVGVLIGITSSAAGFKICAIIAGNKK